MNLSKMLCMGLLAGAMSFGVAGCNKEEPKPMTPPSVTPPDTKPAEGAASDALDKAKEAGADAAKTGAAAADDAKKELDKAAENLSK
ncbi:MAG: hypothetical protein GC162_09060 [Planctomycetes bacterium]|nr:hypothetical protein [Planctomycetota bacterium]